MSRSIIAALSATMLLLFAPSAMASVGTLFEDLQSKQQAIDSDSLARGGALQSLQANCDISGALGAALSGDSKAFGTELENSEKNLRSVANGLPKVAERKKFTKPVKTNVLPEPLTTELGISSPRTGDDILIAISKLAGQSADAIAAIRESKGSIDKLALIIRNNGIISQLILAFYTSVSS